MPNIYKQPLPALPVHPLFDGHERAWAMLAPHVHVRHFKKDDVVLRHGDTANSLWLIYNGWVKLTRQTPDGKETIISLCTKGDVFGKAALFPHANYPYNAEVVGEDAELASVPADALRNMLAEDPGLMENVMALLSERIAQAQLKLEHMSTLSAAQRLGCFFLRLCHTQSQGQKTLKIPVEKHTLAAFLGMKPETLSRSQQQLKELGITINGPLITIGNIAELRDFVCSSCSESGNCDAEPD